MTNSFSVAQRPGHTVATLATGGQGLVEKIEIEGQEFARKRVHYNSADVNQEAIRRLKREFQILSELDNPYIIKAYQPIKYRFDGAEKSFSGYVMELAEVNLKRYCELHASDIEIDQVLSRFWEIACGLSYLHSKSIIHRDLKPENVLIVRQNAKLCDFGLAKALERTDDNITRVNAAGIGTAGYVAPEQFENINYATAASDVYSFGKMLLGAVVGEKAKNLYGAELLEYIRDNDLVLGETLIGCLSYDPRDRFENGSILLNSFYHEMLTSRRGYTITIDPLQSMQSLVDCMEGQSSLDPSIIFNLYRLLDSEDQLKLASFFSKKQAAVRHFVIEMDEGILVSILDEYSSLLSAKSLVFAAVDPIAAF